MIGGRQRTVPENGAGFDSANLQAIPLEQWIKSEEKPTPRRRDLPEPQQGPGKPRNLWAIIKDVVHTGDFVRMPMPVQFHEPLSELQQRAEDLEYTDLLDQAVAMAPHSLDRLLNVAAFSLSAYSGVKRTCKPFNSLMGETYELACPEKGFRFLAEKVQDTPAAMGHAHCEGRGWTFDLEDELRVKFTGTTIDLMPIVLIRVVFKDGDTYLYSKAITSIHNVLMGKIYLEHKGTWVVSNPGGTLSARMRFIPSGMLAAKRSYEVSGTVEANGTAMKGVTLHGRWNESLSATLADGSVKKLWSISPPPAVSNRYDMTTWVLMLNNITVALARKLPPTDTRFRPDLRALEDGIYDMATEEKHRLEKKEKDDGATGAKASKPLQPRWFKRRAGAHTVGEDFLFEYSGGYWEARARRDFGPLRCPFD